MTDALIHLRVSATTKGRWIRASRAAGMRLTDWIIQAVEMQMAQQMVKISIPEGLDFADLHLARDPDGAVSFDWGPIERICTASNISVALLRDSAEDNVAGLIAAWYAEHRARGGAVDATAEDLLMEIEAENAAGQNVSHKPGRA